MDSRGSRLWPCSLPTAGSGAEGSPSSEAPIGPEEQRGPPPSYKVSHSARHGNTGIKLWRMSKQSRYELTVDFFQQENVFDKREQYTQAFLIFLTLLFLFELVKVITKMQSTNNQFHYNFKKKITVCQHLLKLR